MDVWFRGGMSTRVWLLSSFLLFRTSYVKYFMAISGICFMSFFTSQGDIFSFLGLQAIVCVQVLEPLL